MDDDDEGLVSNDEARSLLIAAAQGTPGGFTDVEGQALLDWACKVRAKGAILDTILLGEILPNVHGMVNADSNVILYSPEKAAEAMTKFLQVFGEGNEIEE